VGRYAHLTNLGTTTIASIENGISSPTLDTIEKLAKALGFKIFELLIFDDVEKFARD
jgi:transcriptional regulator with XRE-family HTH domain